MKRQNRIGSGGRTLSPDTGMPTDLRDGGSIEERGSGVHPYLLKVVSGRVTVRYREFRIAAFPVSPSVAVSSGHSKCPPNDNRTRPDARAMHDAL